MDRVQRRRTVVIAVIALVLVGMVPAPVVAQSDAQTGGTVVVDEGETVDELEAFGGTVVVEGTVTGDVNAVAGEVRIEGDVGGNVEAAAGSVTIDGTVDGDVEAATGSFTLTEDGTIGGNVAVGAGTAVIDGTIEGSAEIGAETITLGENAAIAGDLRYGGTLEGNTDAVGGEIEQDSSIGVDLTPTIQPIASWLFSLYVLALNLLLGAALLALFPRFSDRVAGRVASAPVKSGLIGLGVLVAVPILLIALLITVVGIPFAVAGAFGFALMLWIGVIYGRYAVAAWLLSAVGVGNRWLALVVGLVGGAALAQLPYLGSLLNLLIFLLGVGALTYGLYSHRRASRDEPHGSRAEGPASD